MKFVEYGKDAAAAEGRRLQGLALRIGLRIAFLLIAAFFAVFALISAHVLLWVVCYGPWHTGKVWASVIVFGVDILLTGLFVFLGRGRRAGVAELEARMERDRSLSAMRSAMAFSAVTATILGPAGRAAGRSAWSLIRGRRDRPGRGRTR